MRFQSRKDATLRWINEIVRHSHDEIKAKPCISSIPQGIASHQNEVLYIIKSQVNTRYRVMRYKGGTPPLMIYTALRAVMIYQACGLDRKKHLLSQVLFSGDPTESRTPDTMIKSHVLYLLSYRVISISNALKHYNTIGFICQ